MCAVTLGMMLRSPQYGAFENGGRACKETRSRVVDCSCTSGNHAAARDWRRAGLCTIDECAGGDKSVNNEVMGDSDSPGLIRDGRK